jgi:argininosuccinate lyase
VTTPTLLLVESNTTGTGRLFARRCRELGARPVLLADDPDRYGYPAEDGIPVIRADTGSLDAVLAAARALPGGLPAGVGTSSDYFVPVAAAAAAALGRPGPDPEAVARVRHKGAQLALLAAGSVPVARHALVTSVGEATAAACRTCLPVVLKPPDGSGSSGVRLCTDMSQVGEHAARLLARTHNERGMPVTRELLVESYVDGPEFSVEVFGHQAVVVVGKHLGAAPHFVETGHDVPAPLSPDRADALAATATQAVKALGLGFGAAHVELRFGPDGPVLIEVNPRLAGGMIPELVRGALGIDLVTAQVAAALGLPAELEPVRARYASLRFLVVEEPSVLDPAAVAQLTGTTGAVLTGRPGEPLTPHRDHRDRVGHAIATADTSAQAAGAAEAALTRLRTALEPTR